MLDIESINRIGIRISDKTASISYYPTLGFEFSGDAGFEVGHPIIMRHSSMEWVTLLPFCLSHENPPGKILSGASH